MENILELQQVSKTFPKSNFTLENVMFVYSDNPAISMEVKVIALHRAANFKELFEELSLTKCGYDSDDIIDAHIQMEKYPGYSIENQEKYGVVGIEFEEIPFCKPLRDPFRMELFMKEFEDKLMPYWCKHPDYRFGQILANFEHVLSRRSVPDFYYIEDEDFLLLLTEFIQ